MNIDKKFLNEKDNQEIADAIEQFETLTGAELVIAVANQSDPYPGAVYRGAIFIGLILSSIIAYFTPEDYQQYSIIGYFLIILILLPIARLTFIKKLFLDQIEKEREVKEKVYDYFYKLCTTKTSHKTSTFLYFSLLEKKIELLVDEDLNKEMSQEELNQIVARISEHFKKHEFKEGIIESIETLKTKVLAKFPDKCNQITPNEIKNQIHWIEEY